MIAVKFSVPFLLDNLPSSRVAARWMGARVDGGTMRTLINLECISRVVLAGRTSSSFCETRE